MSIDREKPERVAYYCETCDLTEEYNISDKYVKCSRCGGQLVRKKPVHVDEPFHTRTVQGGMKDLYKGGEGKGEGEGKGKGKG